MQTVKPTVGFGLGLRSAYVEEIISKKPPVDWFEIITEDHLMGGKSLTDLDIIRADYPMAMHGVSLSIGSADPIDFDYLAQVKALASRIEPLWISDHLCWTGVDQKNMHDLLPLPYTSTMIDHVAERIAQVQDFLGRQILIENVSSYITYKQSEMTEWEFFKSVCEKADCLMLLDVNNVYVSGMNHGFNPLNYISALPSERIYQIHLAGHLNKTHCLIDTHDHPVANPVWELYRTTLENHGFIATMIERDEQLPPLSELLEELAIARRIASNSEVTCE